MAKRTTIRRYATTEIQGVDSYIKARELTWGEMKANGKRTSELQDQAEELRDNGMYDEAQAVDDEILTMSETLIRERIVEWNWADEEGNPLPLPKDDPAIIDELSRTEVQRLSKLIMQGDEAQTERRKK